MHNEIHPVFTVLVLYIKSFCFGVPLDCKMSNNAFIFAELIEITELQLGCTLTRKKTSIAQHCQAFLTHVSQPHVP